MSSYRFSPNPSDPSSWYNCGPISDEHAKKQWKEFGFRYKGPGGRFLLDYTSKARPVKATRKTAPMATPTPTTLAESAKSVVTGDREESDNV